MSRRLMPRFSIGRLLLAIALASPLSVADRQRLVETIMPFLFYGVDQS